MPKITGDEDTAAGTLGETAPVDALAILERVASPGAGSLVGRYLVLSELGAGGMGVVLAAYDPELDRKVAIKLVRPDASSSASRDRMVREARSMAQLSHPNVVPVFDAGEHHGAVYIAMEFIRGTTLTDRLREPLPWRGVVRLFEAAGRGLCAAHERGMVHRDFKPDNVMVSDDGRIRVMDFGLARTVESEDSSEAEALARVMTDSNVSAALGTRDSGVMTRAGAMMGTPAYMAPEQFQGSNVDERADQFSFCVALWEGLFGRRPFQGEGVWGMAEAVCSGSRAPTPSGRGVPRWLITILNRGLSVDPDERWPSMQALLEEVDSKRTRSRARWVAAGFGAPLVLGLSLLGAEQIRTDLVEERCRDAAQAQMRWPARARTLEQAMVATGQSYAAQTYEGVATRLDAWSQQWVEHRANTCATIELARSPQPELESDRARCLDARMETTERLLDALESGDRLLLVLAVDQIALSSNLERCLDDARLARRPRPPDDIAPAVFAAEGRLREGVLFHLTGRPHKALPLVRDALRQMQEVGYGPGISGVKTQLGSLLVTLGEQDEARTLLAEAFFSAGARGEDDLAAEAARYLAGMGAGAEPYGVEWVAGWAAHARMLHSRLGMERSLEEAEVREALATTLAEAGEPDSIEREIRLLTDARDIRAATLGATHPTVIVGDLNLAMYDLESDPAAVLAVLDDGVVRLEHALGDGHPMLSDLRLMFASVLSAQGRRDEAVAQADAAVELSTRANGASHPRTARARQMRRELLEPSGPTPVP